MSCIKLCCVFLISRRRKTSCCLLFCLCPCPSSNVTHGWRLQRNQDLRVRFSAKSLTFFTKKYTCLKHSQYFVVLKKDNAYVRPLMTVNRSVGETPCGKNNRCFSKSRSLPGSWKSGPTEAWQDSHQTTWGPWSTRLGSSQGMRHIHIHTGNKPVQQDIMGPLSEAVMSELPVPTQLWYAWGHNASLLWGQEMASF